MGIRVTAKNGGSRSLSYLYWSWIRHVASEEGVTLPQSDSITDSFSEDEAKRLASALRARAEKITRGQVPRDAATYVQQIDKALFLPAEKDMGTITADFDEPDHMNEIAVFFESSGGVTLRY